MSTDLIGSGEAYTTPTLWFADIPSTLGENEIGRQTNTAEVVVTGTQSFTGKTVGAFTIVYEANTGQSFIDNANKLTNALRYNAANGAAIRMSSGSVPMFEIDQNALTIRNLMIKKDSSYTFALDYTNSSNSGNALSNCIVEVDSGSNAEVARLRALAVTNTLFVASENSSTGMTLAGGTVTMDRWALINVGTAVALGIDNTYATTTLTNGAVAGFTDDANGTLSGNNNATSLSSSGLPATALQTSLVAATEWENTTYATRDFRLKSSSAKLKDNGTGSGADIVGQAVSGTKDIGVWELQAGGGGGAAAIYSNYVNTAFLS